MFLKHKAQIVAFTLTLTLATGSGASRVSAGPPARLTATGKVRWQFEALLRDTFGLRPVCATGRWAENFTAGIANCTPLATHALYDFAFETAHWSRSHVARRRASNFADNEIAVLIRGKNVACGPRETTFLVEHPDTVTNTLACTGAGHVR